MGGPTSLVSIVDRPHGATRAKAVDQQRLANDPQFVIIWWCVIKLLPEDLCPADFTEAGEGLRAVGDVTGRGACTHVVMYQAGIAVRDILASRDPRPTTGRCRG
jgi:hypothetical protein